MNTRHEKILQETQRLRKQCYEDGVRIKVLTSVAIIGWILAVILMTQVPA